MAYNPDLEQRVDATIAAKGWQLTKVKMFGSMGYKSGDKLCFSVRGDDMLLRASTEMAQRLDKVDGAEPAVMGERQMKNWWQVDGKLLEKDLVLLKLLEQTKTFVESLAA